MINILWDVRYAIRMLQRGRSVTLVAIAILALGIASSTAVFTVINGVLLRPLPYADPDSLVVIWSKNTKIGRDKVSVSPSDYIAWKRSAKSFEDVAAFGFTAFDLVGSDVPESIRAVRASTSLFPVLGVSVARGRTFLPRDELPGDNPVVIVSDGLWKRRFGSDPELVGREVKLDRKPYTVVGILPPRVQFTYPVGTDLWVPLSFDTKEANERKGRYLQVVGRLEENLSLPRAHAEMETIAHQLEQAYPDTNKGLGINIVPLHEHLFGRTRTPLKMLFLAVGFVMLIACANVANLLLVRAAERSKEVAIRTAVGASRPRLIQQMLTESLLLSILGGLLGLLLALWATNALVAIIPADVPRAAEIDVDVRVMAFTLLVSVLTGIGFGIVPALQLSSPNLVDGLKEGGAQSTTGLRARLLRDGLVVLEVALAFTLTICAALMIRSFMLLQDVDAGFVADNLLTMHVPIPRSEYPTPDQRAMAFRQFLERSRSLPDVVDAGATTVLPLSGSDSLKDVSSSGSTGDPPREKILAGYRATSANYFHLMGIKLTQGRPFSEQDAAGTPLVAIVSENLARQLWPGQIALGRSITIPVGRKAETREVIGVVKNVRHKGLEFEPAPELYVPYLQDFSMFISLVVRTRSAPEATATALRTEISSLNRGLPVDDIATMEYYISSSLAQKRFYAITLGTFAGLALLLAMGGVYALISYSVRLQARDIGIRMALGARQSEILRHILTRLMLLVLIGIILGLLVALFFSTFLSTFLFGITSTDVATYLIVSLILFWTGLMAGYVPARRATRIDPNISLRYE